MGRFLAMFSRGGSPRNGSPRNHGVSRKPTSKMLNFAKAIARQMGQPLPDNVTKDGKACSQFIETNKACLQTRSQIQATETN